MKKHEGGLLPRWLLDFLIVPFGTIKGKKKKNNVAVPHKE